MTPGLRSGDMMGSREQLRIGGAIAAGLVLATCVVLIALQVNGGSGDGRVETLANLIKKEDMFAEVRRAARSMLARSTRGREEAEDVAFGFEPSSVIHGHRVTPVSQARAETSPGLDAEIRKMRHFDPALYAKAMSALDPKGAPKPAEENGGGRGKRAGNAHQSPQARTNSGFEYEGSPERVVSQLNKLDRLDLGPWAGNRLPHGDRRALSRQATTAQSKRQQHLESEFFFPHTRAVRGRTPSAAQAGKTKRTASLMKIEFEPALKDAAEREERKAKMDKIHKGFISDPYILGVHVDILTNATLRAADDIAAELREVAKPFGDLETALKDRWLPVEVDLRGKINVTTGSDEAGMGDDQVQACIWITDESSEIFGLDLRRKFLDALASVLGLPLGQLSISYLQDAGVNASAAKAAWLKSHAKEDAEADVAQEAAEGAAGAAVEEGTQGGGAGTNATAATPDYSDCHGCQGWSRAKMQAVMDETKEKIERMLRELQKRPADNAAREKEFWRVNGLQRKMGTINLEEWEQAHRYLLGNYSVAKRLIESSFPPLVSYEDSYELPRPGPDLKAMVVRLQQRWQKLHNALAVLAGRMDDSRETMAHFRWVTSKMNAILSAESVTNTTWLQAVREMNGELQRFLRDSIDTEYRNDEARGRNVVDDLTGYFFEEKDMREEKMQKFQADVQAKIDFMHSEMGAIREVQHAQDEQVSSSMASLHSDMADMHKQLYEVEHGMEHVFLLELSALNASINVFQNDFAFNLSKTHDEFVARVHRAIESLAEELGEMIRSPVSGLRATAMTQLLAQNETNGQLISQLSKERQQAHEEVDQSISRFREWFQTEAAKKDSALHMLTDGLDERLKGLRKRLALVHDQDMTAEKEQQELMALINEDLDSLATVEDSNITDAEGVEASFADKLLANLSTAITLEIEAKHAKAKGDIDAWVESVGAWSTESKEKMATATAALQELEQHIRDEVEAGKARLAKLKASLDKETTNMKSQMEAGEEQVKQEEQERMDAMHKMQQVGEQDIKSGLEEEAAHLQAKLSSDEWLMGYVKGNLQAMHEAAEDGEVTTNTTLESSRDEVSTLEELVTAFEGQEQAAVKQMSDAHDHADQQLLSSAAETEAAISELQEERGRLRGFAPGAIGEAKRLQSSLWTNLTLQLDDTAQQLQEMAGEARANASGVVSALTGVGDSSLSSLQANFSALESWGQALEAEEQARDAKEDALADDVVRIDGLIDALQTQLQAEAEAKAIAEKHAGSEEEEDQEGSGHGSGSGNGSEEHHQSEEQHISSEEEDAHDGSGSGSASADRDRWQNCEAIGGVKGNIGGRDGTAICCPAGCDQCGKKQCLAGNSRAKEKMGLAWVKAHCCVDLEGLGKCSKRGYQKGFPEALPCKCKSQRQCFKGPVDAMAEGGGEASGGAEEHEDEQQGAPEADSHDASPPTATAGTLPLGLGGRNQGGDVAEWARLDNLL